MSLFPGYTVMFKLKYVYKESKFYITGSTDVHCSSKFNVTNV